MKRYDPPLISNKKPTRRSKMTNKENSLYRKIKKMAVAYAIAVGTLGSYGLAYTSVLTATYIKGEYSTKINSEEDLEEQKLAIQKEFNLEDKVIHARFNNGLIDKSAYGRCYKLNDEYVIELDKNEGNNELTLRHEMCHIKHGDLEKVGGSTLSRLKFELIDHPLTHLCGANWY